MSNRQMATKAVSAFAVLLLLGYCPVPSFAQSVYQFDQRSATLGFAVDYLGLFTIEGDFESFAGVVESSDAMEFQRLNIALTIDLASGTTGDAGHDDILRGQDFFSIARYPTARFRGAGSASSFGNTARLTGQASLRGVTLPVILVARFPASGNTTGQQLSQPERRPITAEARFSRHAFGMRAYQGLIGDEITVRLQGFAVLR